MDAAETRTSLHTQQRTGFWFAVERANAGFCMCSLVQSLQAEFLKGLGFRGLGFMHRYRYLYIISMQAIEGIPDALRNTSELHPDA